jgi:hypothetical protein
MSENGERKEIDIKEMCESRGVKENEVLFIANAIVFFARKKYHELVKTTLAKSVGMTNIIEIAPEVESDHDHIRNMAENLDDLDGVLLGKIAKSSGIGKKRAERLLGIAMTEYAKVFGEVIDLKID